MDNISSRRELTYEDLTTMVGQKVSVFDTYSLEYEESLPEQICMVCQYDNGRIYLENLVYVFEYDKNNECLLAKFYVYEIER